MTDLEATKERIRAALASAATNRRSDITQKPYCERECGECGGRLLKRPHPIGDCPNAQEYRYNHTCRDNVALDPSEGWVPTVKENGPRPHVPRVRLAIDGGNTRLAIRPFDKDVWDLVITVDELMALVEK